MKSIPLLAALVFLIPSAAGATDTTKWNLLESNLTYKVEHPLHTSEGVSKAAKGKGNCDEKSCQFLIAVPVKTFDSGDTNRDLHMLEVTKGALHPMVIVHARSPQLRVTETKTIPVDFEIEFAGKKSVYSQVEFSVESKNGELVLHGVIPLKLDDFAVERPALLGIAIKNEAPITVNATWKTE